MVKVDAKRCGAVVEKICAVQVLEKVTCWDLEYCTFVHPSVFDIRSLLVARTRHNGVGTGWLAIILSSTSTGNNSNDLQYQKQIGRWYGTVSRRT